MKKIIKLNKHLIYVLLVAFGSLDFFSPIGLTNLGRLIYIILITLSLPSVFLQIISKKKLVFGYAIKLFFLAVLLSIFSAFIFRNQSIFDGFIAVLFSVGGYSFYFYFLKKNFSVSVIEKSIWIIGVVYILLFSITFLIYPQSFIWNAYNPILNSENLFMTEELERGFQRVILNGHGFLFLFFFFVLNKNAISSNKKWTIASLVTYICIILTLTRMYIIVTTLIAIIYLLRNAKKRIKIGLGVVIIASIFIVPKLGFVQRIVEYTIRDTEAVEGYIRLQEAEFFLNKFQVSSFTKIFGNGFPKNTSEYGIKIDKLEKNDNFYITDLGVLGLYIYLGILGVVAYVIIFYKGIKAKLPQEYLYLKMYIIFVTIVSTTTFATYHLDFLMPIVFTLYLYERVAYKKIKNNS